MNMNAQRVIEHLGYSTKEAKVYLAALALGESHISDIAERVGLPHSSVQAIAHKLHKQGLLNFYVMRRYKYWVAENPERLLVNLKKREESLGDLLPTLSAIRKEGWSVRHKKSKPTEEWEPFRVLADNSPQAILITNAKAEIVYVNIHWEKQFGYTLDEVQGQNPRILQSGKTDSSIYEHMWRSLEQEKMFQSEDIIERKKDGTFLNIMTTILPLRHNNHLFFIQILDEVTKQKHLEETKYKFLGASKR